jgi:hypothetical protein
MTPDIKVVFAEGSMDEFEGSPDELAEFVAEIQTMANNGTLFENSTLLSEEEAEELGSMLRAKARRQ